MSNLRNLSNYVRFRAVAVSTFTFPELRTGALLSMLFWLEVR
jgi:hypothetical protein